MVDPFFRNVMPNFLEEKPVDDTTSSETNEDSLTKLLSLPNKTLSDSLKSSALDLKDTVVRETWGLSGKRVQDYTVYTGALGTAYLVFKAYQVTKNANDLKLCLDIVKACDSVSRDSSFSRVTFLCGRAGVCALGAVAAKHASDERLLGHYLTQFKEIKPSSDLPNELLYGRAGFLWASSFINHHIGNGTISSTRRVFEDKQFLQAAMDAGDVVWEQGLLKRVGICHGISGNAYVFLALYRLTGQVEYLYKAKAFACFLHDRAQKLIFEGRMHGGNRPNSLFEGIGGMAHLFLDMLEPSGARFPGYEL